MDPMSRLVVLWSLLGIPGGLVFAMTQHEYFPGLRRPPSVKISSNSYDESYLAQILTFIEEQARRRFQEKLVNNINQQNTFQDQGPDESGFTYHLSQQETIPDIDTPYQFGVGPNDPRFYDNAMQIVKASEGQHLSGPMKTSNAVASDDGSVGNDLVEEGPYLRIKGPLNVNPKQPSDNIYKERLLQKLGHNLNGVPGFDSDFLANSNNLMNRHDVIQRPVESNPVGLYAVALIAGVSAAITVGLIALGIGWYTFYKKSKAAQDVEYPAYGVTGPNKEMSPTSGDRRLAQNAQMYHYQHQKQQIIAMENKINEERNGNLSEVNSEDENEEDYTVYECPGLAPPGEMEVKNPLFFDDPTPATPASNSEQQQQQPAKTTTVTTTVTKQTSPKSSSKTDNKPKK